MEVRVRRAIVLLIRNPADGGNNGVTKTNREFKDCDNTQT